MWSGSLTFEQFRAERVANVDDGDDDEQSFPVDFAAAEDVVDLVDHRLRLQRQQQLGRNQLDSDLVINENRNMEIRDTIPGRFFNSRLPELRKGRHSSAS